MQARRIATKAPNGHVSAYDGGAWRSACESLEPQTFHEDREHDHRMGHRDDRITGVARPRSKGASATEMPPRRPPHV